MPSKIDIVNMALSRLMTSKTLASIDEPRPEAVQMRIWYDQTLDRLLSIPEHEWGFARTFTALSVSEFEMPGWDFTYAYPSDCLGLRVVGPRHAGAVNIGTGYPHEVGRNGDYLLIGSNCRDAHAVYTSRVSEARMPAAFIDALVFALAANTAMPITSSPQLAQQMQQGAASALHAAMARDKNNDHMLPEPLPASVRYRLGDDCYDHVPTNDTYDPWGLNRG